MENLENAVLGATDSTFHLRSAEEHRRVALAMARQAKRSLHLYTRALDPAVYDDGEIEEAFAQFALRSKNSNIFILVHETARAVQQGHGLIRLAQKLPSRVQIKIPSEDYQQENEAFFIADVLGLIRQPVPDSYSAQVNFKAPFDARKLIQHFDEVWQRADIDPQLRRLFL